jgi:hypothetical protein
MQIHELTQPRLNEGITDTIGSVVGKGVSAVKGAGQAVASPFKDVAAGYSSGRQGQKIDAMADKAYRSWKSYEGQLLKADPDARQNGDYEKQLLAFVNKNLLGGMYLPNVINKDKIITLVQKISAPQPAVGTQTATSTGGTATTTAGGKVNTANPNNPNLKATVPGPNTAKTTPQTPASPSAANPTYPVKGATKPGAPTPDEQANLEKKIAAAAAKTPMNEAVDPTQELFKQLVQQAALAQTTAPGTSGASSSTPSATTAGNNPQASARGMAQALQRQLTPALVSGLPTVGATAAKLSGDTQVTSTGNPAADGLLILMGFQGL